MKRRTYPLAETYRLIEPGPVVMMTTALRGRSNVMTMSWHTMLEFEPALIGCVISDRNYSFEALKKTKECVIAIPTVDIATKVVKVGNSSGRDIDKFKAFGLTALLASKVKAPLIAECYVNIECKVVDTAMVNKYNFFVLKAVKTWIDPTKKNPRTIHHLGKGIFMVAGKKMKLPSKMK